MSTPNTDKPTTCPVPMQDGNPCGRQSYDGERFCILHSKDPSKDRGLFRSARASLGAGHSDFTAFVFPAERVSFNSAVFNTPACFHLARFLGSCDFAHAKFRAGANFSDATFEGDALFASAEFGRPTSPQNAVFACATFLQRANFDGAKFYGTLGCYGVQFANGASFRQAELISKASFEGTKSGEMFSGAADTIFTDVVLGRPQEVVFKRVFLGQTRLLGTDVPQIDFTDVKWAKRGRLNALWDELAPEDDGEEKNYALIGKLYRQLKHNYEEQRDPITAGDFHFGEMHMRRLSNPPKNWFLRFLKRNISLLALYRWISGYGEDYILPLVWIAGVVLLFTGIFALVGLQVPAVAPSNVSQPVHGFWPHLLYSIGSLLLRPWAQYEPPTLLGRYLTAAEGIMGPPLIAMFVLALNRRFKR